MRSKRLDVLLSGSLIMIGLVAAAWADMRGRVSQTERAASLTHSPPEQPFTTAWTPRGVIDEATLRQLRKPWLSPGEPSSKMMRRCEARSEPLTEAGKATSPHAPSRILPSRPIIKDPRRTPSCRKARALPKTLSCREASRSPARADAQSIPKTRATLPA